MAQMLAVEWAWMKDCWLGLEWGTVKDFSKAQELENLLAGLMVGMWAV